MNLYRRCFLESMVGAAASLAAWTCTTWIVFLTVPGRVPGDLAAAALLGLFAGIALPAAQEIFEHRRATPSWLWGAFSGPVAALTGVALYMPADAALRDTQPEWNRLFQWLTVSGLIGLAIGLRWVVVNRSRVAFSALGGLCGGAAGGTILGYLSGSPDISPAIAYMISGAFLGWGYSFCPPEARSACLLFVRSSDERTNNKLRNHLPWTIDAAGSLLIGNPTVGDPKPETGDLPIGLLDPTVAANHARVFYRRGQFLLARHADIRDDGGRARYRVRAGEQSVGGEQILRDGDELQLGSTTFRFEHSRGDF